MAIDRSILRPTMLRAIRQGTSFNQFYRSAQGHGLSYQRAAMLADWQSARGEMGTPRYTGPQDLGQIPEADIVGPGYFRIPGFYYYKVKLSFTRQLEERPKTEFVTVKSSEQLTLRDIMNRVAQMYADTDIRRQAEVRNFELLSSVVWPEQ